MGNSIFKINYSEKLKLIMPLRSIRTPNIIESVVKLKATAISIPAIISIAPINITKMSPIL